MASHTVTINGVAVPVRAAEGAPASVDIARVLTAKPFIDWARGVDPALEVSEVAVQSVDYFGSRVGFIKMVATTEFQGHRIPGIVFLRGGGA